MIRILSSAFFFSSLSIASLSFASPLAEPLKLVFVGEEGKESPISTTKDAWINPTSGKFAYLDPKKGSQEFVVGSNSGRVPQYDIDSLKALHVLITLQMPAEIKFKVGSKYGYDLLGVTLRNGTELDANELKRLANEVQVVDVGGKKAFQINGISRDFIAQTKLPFKPADYEILWHEGLVSQDAFRKIWTSHMALPAHRENVLAADGGLDDISLKQQPHRKPK